MTCANCGATIKAERTGKTFRGVVCEVCLDKAEACAPGEHEGGYDGQDALETTGEY
jgi:reverse gyrase